jgi:hypothetical protein
MIGFLRYLGGFLKAVLWDFLMVMFEFATDVICIAWIILDVGIQGARWVWDYVFFKMAELRMWLGERK